MEKEYEYEVTAIEMIPPLANGFRYAGKVAYIYEMNESQDIVVDTFPHKLLRAERWGFTAKEATELKTKDVENWIAKNK